MILMGSRENPILKVVVKRSSQEGADRAICLSNMAENREDFNDSVIRLNDTIAWDVWLSLLVWKVQVLKPVRYWKRVFGED